MCEASHIPYAFPELPLPHVSRWQPVETAPPLGPGELHLWRLNPSTFAAKSGSLLNQLPPDQRERLSRINNPEMRARRIAVHAELRAILAGYARTTAAALPMGTSATGKPHLLPPHQRIEMNLTDSGDLALLAISLDEPVGVDCERLRPRKRDTAILRRMLGDETAAHLESLQGEERQLAFHTAWTALEADVKADGRGLSRARQPGLPGLEIRHCIPEPGHVAAVARRELPEVADWRFLQLDTDAALTAPSP